MKSFAGPLREARTEVIPRIPELAPQLADDQEVIKTALCESLERRGVDPARVSSGDMNKAERHTVAGFLIGEQRHTLVAGSGTESRFRSFANSRPGSSIGGELRRFQDDLQITLAISASQVEADYTYGDTPDRRWFPLASERYNSLGKAATYAAGLGAVPLEGLRLYDGLRTHALGSTLAQFIRFVRERTDEQRDDRVKAAHDIAALPTMWAGLHFIEFVNARSFELLQASIRPGPDGRYRLELAQESRRDEVFPRKGDTLPNSRLKCPAHAFMASTGQVLSGETAREGAGVYADTNLDYLVHAGINAAAGRKLL